VGSTGKKRTTMAKLNRESRLRDKRAEKQARRAARKLTLASAGELAGFPPEELGAGSAGLDSGMPDSERAERLRAVADRNPNPLAASDVTGRDI
jgi:hypothetical protein